MNNPYKKYAYKLLTIEKMSRHGHMNDLIDHKQLEEQLNSAAQEGWRLVSKYADYARVSFIMEKEPR